MIISCKELQKNNELWVGTKLNTTKSDSNDSIYKSTYVLKKLWEINLKFEDFYLKEFITSFTYKRMIFNVKMNKLDCYPLMFY